VDKRGYTEGARQSGWAGIW